MTRPAAASAPYLRIADDLERRIAAGELRPGDRIPSTRQITRDWAVAIATATKALGELRSRGLVQALPGVGTVVAGGDAGTSSDREAPSGRPDPDSAFAPRGHSGPNQSRSTAGAGTPRRTSPRGAGPDTTRERILRIAIAIADAEGLAAVSMRRIAIEMNVATMSLYRWVPSKDDLLNGMLNGLMDGEWPEPPPGWRAQLEYVARRQWAAYRAHPWLARLVSLTRPQLAPDAMMHTERALRAVSGLGFDNSTMLLVVLVVFGYVQGIAMNLDSEARAEQETGLDSDEWMKLQDATFTPIIASGRYPNLAALDGQPDIDVSIERRFEFGLALTLDGLAKLVDETAVRCVVS